VIDELEHLAAIRDRDLGVGAVHAQAAGSLREAHVGEPAAAGDLRRDAEVAGGGARPLAHEVGRDHAGAGLRRRGERAALGTDDAGTGRGRLLDRGGGR